MSLLSLPLFANAAAMTAQQRAAIDKYIASGQSDTAGIALRKKMAARVGELESRFSPIIVDLGRLGPPAQRRLGIVQESLKGLQNLDLNVYNDVAWREHLVKSQTAYCCEMYNLDSLKTYVADLEDQLRTVKGKMGKKSEKDPAERARLHADREKARAEARENRRGQRGRQNGADGDGDSNGDNNRRGRNRDQNANADSSGGGSDSGGGDNNGGRNRRGGSDSGDGSSSSGGGSSDGSGDSGSGDNSGGGGNDGGGKGGGGGRHHRGGGN